MTTKSPAEMDELRAQGPAAVKAYLDAETRNVFGHDVKFDKNGNPIEQGIGSRGNETANHFAGLLKRELEGLEPEGSYDLAVEDFYQREPEKARLYNLVRKAPVKKVAS